jgi:3-oxoacyl-[acyl-carrier protein] reductase
VSELDGKVAIITGAAQGLGRVEALELAKQGARIVVNDFSGPAEDVVEEIKAAGGEATAHRGDVADWDTAKAIVDTAVSTYGQLDILVNNAGFLRDRILFNMSEDEFDTVVRVHLKGHFCMSRWAATHWRETAKAGDGTVYGRIINTASESALLMSPGQPNYGPAKAGIIALTGITANTLGRFGITANVIAPRARTPMTEEQPLFQRTLPGEGEFDLYAPENVAPLVAWLASPSSQQVSGQLFLVWGQQITVMVGPRIDTQFTTDARWTPERVHEHLEPFFAGRTPIVDGVMFTPPY